MFPDRRRNRPESEVEQIFTRLEKKHLWMRGFRDVALDHVDFSGADLREAFFQGVSLAGSDFSRADLRGAKLLNCDLRGARFGEARWGDNAFDGSCFVGAVGLSSCQREEIRSHGGRFCSCERPDRA